MEFENCAQATPDMKALAKSDFIAMIVKLDGVKSISSQG
jgi:hypothetical protein